MPCNIYTYSKCTVAAQGEHVQDKDWCGCTSVCGTCRHVHPSLLTKVSDCCCLLHAIKVREFLIEKGYSPRGTGSLGCYSWAGFRLVHQTQLPVVHVPHATSWWQSEVKLHISVKNVFAHVECFHPSLVSCFTVQLCSVPVFMNLLET